MKKIIFKSIIPVFFLGALLISCQTEVFPEITPKSADYNISNNNLILNSTINDIDFIGTDNGFAVGLNVLETVTKGVVLKTTNAGKDWQKLDTPELLGQYYSNYFIDKNTGTIVGNLGTIISTTDGGLTFTKATSGTTETLYGVTFFDKNNGACVGAKGILLTTQDGGLTWVKKASGVTTDLRAVFMKDATTIVITGDKGVLRVSTNLGSTWSVIDTKESIRFQDMHFPTPNIGYAAGQDGIVIKIDLASNTVKRLYLPVDDQIRGIFFINEQLGYTAGSYGEVLKTINGGNTWKIENIDPIAYTMLALDFPTENRGYIAGVKTFLTTNK